MYLIKTFKTELLKIAAFIFLYTCSVVHVLNSSGAGIEKVMKYISESMKF